MDRIELKWFSNIVITSSSQELSNTAILSSCRAALTHNLTSLFLPLSDTDTQYEGMKGVTWLSKMASLLQI